MQIGIDLRFLKNDDFSHFVLTLVKNYIKSDSQNTYTIYLNHQEKLDIPGVSQKQTHIAPGSLKEQVQYYKILSNDKNDLMIFFTHHKPLLYKKDYYVFIASLKDIYYNNFSKILKKYHYIYSLEQSVKNAQKIICFDSNTISELIERFNIMESRINKIYGFFPIEQSEEKSPVNIDIKSKYSLNNEYIIYSGGEGIEKNYEKILHCIKKLHSQGTKLGLVLLGENICRNIALRNLSLELGIEKYISFLGEVSKQEEQLLYQNALGTILTSFYEPFPFCLTQPVQYKSPLLMSNLKSLKDIFGEQAEYFSPISINSIYKSLQLFIGQAHTPDYDGIKKIYCTQHSSQQFRDIIN